ncbi:MAG: AAA family ATPase [Vampirovibrionales bacterium]|nr:AAA family ATPase [Vampirovibrionales bacterium]
MVFDPNLNKPLWVVAVATSEQTRASLQQQLLAIPGIQLHENTVCLRLEEAFRACQKQLPDVLLVEMTDREVDAGLFIEALATDTENPLTVFALYKNLEATILLETFRRGAREFIEYPSDPKSLEAALKRQMNILNRGSGPQQLAKPPEGKLVTLFGAKGGCGVSTIAFNLAFELRQSTKSPVLLIDFDQVFNNTAVLINLKPTHCLGELSRLGATGDLDEALVNQLICSHESGLDVIVGSKDALDENEMLPLELFDACIARLRKRYKYIVIDLPTHVLDPYHEYLIEKSTDVFVVSGLEIPALYRTRQYLDLARQYLSDAKCKLVINRWNLKAAYGVSNHRLVEAFQHPVSYRLPNDWNLNVEANSLGCPLGAVSTKAELVVGIRQMALDLAGLGSTGQQTALNDKGVRNAWGSADGDNQHAKPGFWQTLLKRLWPFGQSQNNHNNATMPYEKTAMNDGFNETLLHKEAQQHTSRTNYSLNQFLDRTSPK